MRSVTLDGRTYPIRQVLKTYQEQRAEERRSKQLALFELREDVRPKSQQSGQGRFQQPLLFD